MTHSSGLTSSASSSGRIVGELQTGQKLPRARRAYRTERLLSVLARARDRGDRSGWEFDGVGAAGTWGR
jgi:hypothetical protein